MRRHNKSLQSPIIMDLETDLPHDSDVGVLKSAADYKDSDMIKQEIFSDGFHDCGQDIKLDAIKYDDVKIADVTTNIKSDNVNCGFIKPHDTTPDDIKPSVHDLQHHSKIKEFKQEFFFKEWNNLVVQGEQPIVKPKDECKFRKRHLSEHASQPNEKKYLKREFFHEEWQSLADPVLSIKGEAVKNESESSFETDIKLWKHDYKEGFDTKGSAKFKQEVQTNLSLNDSCKSYLGERSLLGKEEGVFGNYKDNCNHLTSASMSNKQSVSGIDMFDNNGESCATQLLPKSTELDKGEIANKSEFQYESQISNHIATSENVTFNHFYHKHTKTHNYVSTDKQCPYCHNVYKSSQSLSRHINEMNTQRYKECVICKKYFDFACQMILHFKNENHTECPHCTEVFADYSKLLTHLMLTKVCNIKCHICNKVFRYQCLLKRHVKTHKKCNRSETDKQCPYCHNVYKSSQSLSRHINEMNTQRLKECVICKKHFDFSCQMILHFKNENHTECPHCAEVFADYSELLTHLMLAKVCNFKCHICYEVFQYQCQLRRHVKTHNEWNRSEKWVHIWAREYVKARSDLKQAEKDKLWPNILFYHCKSKTGLPNHKLYCEYKSCKNVFSEKEIGFMNREIKVRIRKKLCPFENPIPLIENPHQTHQSLQTETE